MPTNGSPPRLLGEALYEGDFSGARVETPNPFTAPRVPQHGAALLVVGSIRLLLEHPQQVRSRPGTPPHASNPPCPLVLDFCLRVGSPPILLGVLGFFGLGLSPESPDWGSTINAGSRLLAIYPIPALAPALALMSLVLGLNLLADGLREESLKD